MNSFSNLLREFANYITFNVVQHTYSQQNPTIKLIVTNNLQIEE